MSLTRVPMDTLYMKLTRRKHPDHLADPCKRSSINRMAAGSRLPRSSHGFSPFSILYDVHNLLITIMIIGEHFT